MKKMFLRLIVVFLIAFFAACNLSLVGASAITTSDGVLYLISNGEARVADYTGDSTSVTILEEIEGCPVTGIGDNAFYDFNCNVESVYIPSSVTFIGNCAFSGCRDLKNVSIPDGVVSIGYNAFEGCSSLTSLIIPASVTNIGEAAFIGCGSIDEIVVDKSNAVYDSRGNCNAIVETDTDKLVVGCKRTQIPQGIKEIGAGAFMDCDGLENITIPYGVTEIGASAFKYCSGLKNVTIPISVTKIATESFLGCDALTDVHYEGTSEVWDEIEVGSSNEELLNAEFYFAGLSRDPSVENDVETMQDTGFESEDKSSDKKVDVLLVVAVLFVAVILLCIFISTRKKRCFDKD